MCQKTLEALLSLPHKMQVAFLVLLFERMLPELRSFRVLENLDLSVYEVAHRAYWEWLRDSNMGFSWEQLRDDNLGATPSSEDFGTLSAQFALNASLVEADIAGFLLDGEDAHILESIRYALDSVEVKIMEDMNVQIYSKELIESVRSNPLFLKELLLQQSDISFLIRMENLLLDVDFLAELRRRSEMQAPLFSREYEGS